jgi:uncharacterized membrane protein
MVAMNATSASHKGTPNIDLLAPWRWLSQGWSDLRRNPLPGLVHGLALTAGGGLIVLLAWDRFWLLAGAFSGFLIVAPILATGLYHVSRACSTGRCAGMREVIGLWRSGDGRLVRFGLLLGLAGTGWVLTSAALITVMADQPIRQPLDFLRHVVLVPGVGLFELWLVMGAVLAAPMFASTVVALPMLVDQRVSVGGAVRASWMAVANHPVPLGLWAVLLSVFTGLAMLLGLVGLMVVVPWLAHASWHAYCELQGLPSSGTAKLNAA